MTIVAKALALAERGFLVFPCAADKRPCCKLGFKAASRDPAVIARLFRLPRTELIGVPTGSDSGFDVLDWDPKNGGSESIALLRPSLPDTREHRTRSGGGHLFFRHHEGVRNSASKIARGIDTRGNGGYIIWWPGHGGLISNVALPAAWPAFLLRELLRAPEPTPGETAWRERVKGDDTYARRVVQRQLERVASAPPGQRHDTLRKAGKIIGGILHMDDATSHTDVAQSLYNAVREAGGDDVSKENATATIEWALDWGKRNPLTERGTRG